jgi:hypothetical protein
MRSKRHGGERLSVLRVEQGFSMDARSPGERSVRWVGQLRRGLPRLYCIDRWTAVIATVPAACPNFRLY